MKNSRLRLCNLVMHCDVSLVRVFVLHFLTNGDLNKKSLNLKRVLYPKLYDTKPILLLGPFLEPYELFILD